MGKRASPRPEARQAALVAALAAAARRAASDPAEVEVIETHISWVLLRESRAYKIKKAVTLPFLDFGTLEARRRYCEEELRLNRRLAPELYLDVVPIGGSWREPRLGAEPAIEYAVEMQRFPDSARLDRQLEAGRLDAGALGEFAVGLAAFHRALPAAPRGSPLGTAAAVAKLALDNVAELGDCLVAGSPEARRAAALGDWTRSRACALAGIMAARRAAGRIKEGHGDLHLANLATIGTRIVPFDALEFAPGLRWGDVVGEAAFLAMDLLARGRPDLAFGFLDRYFAASGDYAGLEVLGFYLVYRALVRAKTGAIEAAQHGRPFAGAARSYLELADALRAAARRRPLLVIMHGLSGSGKTRLSGELLGRLPALRVRSDVERRRLLERPGRARGSAGIGKGLYASSASALTYRWLARCARHGLGGGFDMIVDAAFLDPDQRHVFAELAQALGAGFALVALEAPPEQLRERVRRRAAAGRDPSEATEAVLAHQLAHAEPLAREERATAVVVDTAAAIDYDAIGAALDARRRATGR